MIGKLVDVVTKTIGSVLSKDHSTDDMILYVADISPFWDSDTLMIGEKTIKYTVVVDEEVSQDEDYNDNVCYLALETPLTTDYAEDTEVDVYPLQNVRFGTVLIGTSVIICPIDSRLWPYLADGIRED